MSSRISCIWAELLFSSYLMGCFVPSGTRREGNFYTGGNSLEVHKFQWPGQGRSQSGQAAAFCPPAMGLHFHALSQHSLGPPRWAVGVEGCGEAIAVLRG